MTFIGVVEYSPIFIGGPDPMADALRMARRALKPDGKLIIAIENQLGLKYFLGYNEDHIARPYFGIEGLHTSKTAKTLGQEEMRGTLRRAGFASHEFHYPFPDYKIPTAVLTEEAFRAEGFAPGELVRQVRIREYGQNTPCPVHEAFVWPYVAANGLLEAMANSFLIFASQKPDVAPICKDLLAALYTNNRRPVYNTCTRFLRQPSGNIVVTKEPLQADLPERSSALRHALKESPYASGTHFGSELVKKFLMNDLEGFLTDCRLWIEFVKQNGLAEGADGSWGSPLNLEYTDCIPINLIRTSEGLVFIDREWQIECTLDLLIVRGLFLLFLHHKKEIDYSESTFEAFLKGLLARLGLEYDAALRERFVAFQTFLSQEINDLQEADRITRYSLYLDDEAQAAALERARQIDRYNRRFEVRVQRFLVRKSQGLFARGKRLLTGRS